MTDDIRLETFEQLLQQTDGPGTLLPSFWIAAGTGEVPWNATLIPGAERDLSRAVTSAREAWLAEVLRRLVESPEEVHWRMASMIEVHASALYDLGRSREALPLYLAALPVLERRAS